MEFWGVEVKSGQPLSVSPGEDKVLHLSQACLGEVKKDKGNDSVCLFVNIDGKKLVLGTLSHDKLPQQMFDLVFDRDFELTHNWKNGSVYFYGYKAEVPSEEPEDEFDSDDEDIPLYAANNGKQEIEAKQEKPSAAENANAVKGSAAGKQKVKIVEPSKGKPNEDDESDESDDAMSEDESEPEEGAEGSSDDDSDDNEDSDEEDEETPKKVQSGKKRPTESATKTPGPDKKAKLVTPQKTDGKKGAVHVATPHPSKQQGGKTPANKSAQNTPKSEGSHSCKSCNRNFKSENALQSHNQAKHSAAK